MKRDAVPFESPPGPNSSPGGSSRERGSAGTSTAPSTVSNPPRAAGAAGSAPVVPATAAAASAPASPPVEGVARRAGVRPRPSGLSGAAGPPEISTPSTVPAGARSSSRPLFDLVVIVDWSASSVPTVGRDSIWICARPAGADAAPVHLSNPPTRARAARVLRELLLAATGRVLVGCDVSYGYPAGTARAAGLDGPRPWRAMWDHLARAIHDAPDNTNNRFAVAAALNARISSGAGPFWGTTSAVHAGPSLSPRKAPGFPHPTSHGQLAERRLTERLLAGRVRFLSSTWQLAGAGSVGSQALTAIPVLGALRDHPGLRQRSVVWPFETGFTDDPTSGRADAIVHAEVWPSLVPLDTRRHPVRDAAQVLGLADHLASLDAAGRLAPLFALGAEPGRAPLAAVRGGGTDVTAVLDEEGWILGVLPPTAGHT